MEIIPNTSGTGSNVAAIIGGVVGGVVAIIFLLAILILPLILKWRTNRFSIHGIYHNYC